MIRVPKIFRSWRYDLDIWGCYAASENAIFHHGDCTHIKANDYFNDGIIYSKNKHSVNAHSKATKWGMIVSEDDITFNALSPKAAEISDAFTPIIDNKSKKVTIKSKDGVKITSSINWNVNLNVAAPTFEANEDIAVRRFDAKTDSFRFGGEKTDSDSERKQLSTQEGINIDTKEFINRSGKIESLGNIRIKVDGTFINTGGGFQVTDPDKKPCLKIYDNKPENNGEKSPVGEKQYEGEYWLLREENAGCITTGSILEIIAKKFDNSFGILNAAKRLQIESEQEVLNRSGLIYSGGSATIRGTLLDNGYLRSNLPPIHDYDPKEKIYGNYTVPYNVWVQSGYWTGSGGFLGGICGKKRWVNTSHWETRYKNVWGVIGYKPRTQYFNASDRHGYIFTNDDLDIFMSGDLFFGRIVSARNVRINGKEQQTNNGEDRGEIIVGGNVDAEYQKLSLTYTAIQAQDVLLKTYADLQIHGIIVPTCKRNGETAYIINAEKLAADLGFMIAPSAFALPNVEGDIEAENDMQDALVPTTLSSRTGLIPLDSRLSDSSLTFYSTDQAGFIGLRPNVPVFIPTIPNNLITRLLVLTLAPIYGRSVLTNCDLLTSLIQQGHRIEADFGGDHSIVLREKESPALMFEKSDHPEIEIDIDGEKNMVPLYKPYIFMDTVSRIITEINAKIATIVAKNVDIHPGPLPIKAPTTNIKALEKLSMKGNFSPARNNVNPVSFPPEVKDLNLSGDHGIETEGVDLSLSGNLLMESKHGSIIDRSMSLDPEYIQSWHDVSMRRRTFTSSFQAASALLTAPEGSISHEGTNLVSGGSGTTIHSKTYTWTPAYEDYGFYHSDNRGYAKTDLHTPKAGGLQSLGKITFTSTDTTLVGAHIVANTISNPVDGTFRTIPAYATQTSESYTVSRGGFLGLGESSRRVQETREMVRPTYQLSEHFESTGVGTYEMESTVMRALDATITKNLVERTAYDRITTRITDTSRGICAPKIKGDPLFEAMRGLESIRGDGDTLPTVFNLVSSGAQAGTHALTLANLARNPNPFGAVTSILLNRFVSGPVISHTKTVTERKESIPHQSDVQVGILRIDNSRTHLEGIWNVTDRTSQSHIMTSEFTTDAPRRTVEQTSHTTGWSVALSPAALVGLGLGFPGVTAAAALPSVSLQKADSDTFFSSPQHMALTADDLLITCDNAVIRGSKIQARLLEMIVRGDLTIESLKEEFRSDANSASIGTKLDALYGFITNSMPISGLGDSRLGSVPTMRFVDEETLSEKVHEVAQLVGQEKFLLTVSKLLHKIGATVGLQPDGVVVSDDAERINAGQILEEKVRETEHYERHVFNPSLAELCNMVGEVDAFKQLRAKIELQQMKEGVPVEEREKDNREVKEFLDKTEVKQAYKKLDGASRKIRKAKAEMQRLEAENPEFAEMTKLGDDASSSSSSSAPSVDEQMDAIFAYSRARRDFEAGRNEIMEQMASLNESLDAYGREHPSIEKYSDILVNSIGIAAMAGIVFAAHEVGLVATMGTAATTVAYGELFNYLVENGSDKFVEYCALQGRTEAESVRYGTAAAGIVGKLLKIAVIRGGLKTIGGKTSSKDKAKILLKTEAEAVSKRVFSEKTANENVATAKIMGSIAETIVPSQKRIDIIHEPEMIQMALAAPTEWKGQFKLVREFTQISGNAEFSKLYSKEVLFKDPKSGQMFRVLQRNDIDPNYVIPKGRNRGKTNLEAMLKGHAPYTISGEMVQLHHIGQDARGCLAEVTEKTHRTFPHGQFGKNKSHPTYPVIRSEFDPIRIAYWRSYAEQFK